MVESIKIKNIDTDLTKQFDMSEADYLIYEGSVDWGNIQVSHSTFQFPKQVGSYVSNTTLGSRDISINGWIIGNTLEEIEAKKRSLSAFANPLNEFQIIVGEYSINGHLNSNVTFGKSLNENSNVAVKFLLQFTCNYPLFLLSNAISVDVAKYIGAFHFPLVLVDEGIVMGYRKQTLFQKIGNGGAIEVGMKIVLEANGTVNNPTIVNTNTHETFKINKILTAGEKIVINTKIGERNIEGSVNGGEFQNYLKYMDYDSVWLQVQKGVNTYTYATYNNEGDQDDSYELLDVTIEYRTAIFNLGEE